MSLLTRDESSLSAVLDPALSAPPETVSPDAWESLALTAALEEVIGAGTSEEGTWLRRQAALLEDTLRTLAGIELPPGDARLATVRRTLEGLVADCNARAAACRQASLALTG